MDFREAWSIRPAGRARPGLGEEVAWILHNVTGVTAAEVSSIQSTPTIETAPSRHGSHWHARAALLLGVCSFLLYLPVIVGMAQEWWRNEAFSHGFLVPVIAGYLAWRRRAQVQAVARPAPWGMALLFAGLLLHALGLAAAVEFLGHLSLLLVLGGLLLYAWGPAAARVLAFPYAFLLFMVPWPDTLVEFLSFPMQLLSAKFAAMLVGLVGVPAVRTGVDIHLPRYDFTVGAPCSGMKSLVSLLTLAALAAYLLQGPRGKRLALFLLGLPLAMLANVLRIAFILLIAQFWGMAAAEGFLHKFSGALVFVLASAGLLLVGRALGLGYGATPAEPPAPGPAGANLPPLGRRALFAPMLAVLLMAGLAAASWGNRHPTAGAPANLEAIPWRVAHWQSRDLGALDRVSAELLHPDAYTRRLYRREDGYPVEMSVLTGHEKETFHSPGFCLLGGGWNITRKSRTRLAVAGGRPLEASEFWLQRGEEQRVVVYWYASPNETTPSWVALQYRLFRNRLLGRPATGALIRFTAPVADSPEQAEAVIAELVSQVGPGLTQALAI
jgi:EpsI family protein